MIAETIEGARVAARIETLRAQQERLRAELAGNQAAPAPDSYQVGGNHYTALAVQPWQAMRAWMSPEQYRGFLKGNAIKYIARSGKKGKAQEEVEDLRKAEHYLAELLAQYVAMPE